MPSRPQDGRPQEASNYSLYILTHAVGLDLSSSEKFLRTLHKHPRGPKDDHTVGHSWLILESPNTLIECGHTGEFGIEKPLYYRGVMQGVARKDANPIAYLWETMHDGQFHRGPGCHRPTFVCLIPITATECDNIYHYINGYDYSQFSLVAHDCTDFVSGAAALAGVPLRHRVRITLPQEVSFHGRRIRLWTNPRFSLLNVGIPDILEEHLKELVRQGAAEDATSWYHN